MAPDPSEMPRLSGRPGVRDGFSSRGLGGLGLSFKRGRDAPVTGVPHSGQTPDTLPVRS